MPLVRPVAPHHQSRISPRLVVALRSVEAVGAAGSEIRSDIPFLASPAYRLRATNPRAVAASVLFDGTDKAKQYVSTDRILFGNLIMDSETGGLDRA